jgi:hypothetical protein
MSEKSHDTQNKLLPSRNTPMLPIVVFMGIGFIGLMLLWASFTDGASVPFIGYTILLTVGFIAITLGTFSIAALHERRKKKLDD